MEALPFTNVTLQHDLFRDAAWVPCNGRGSHGITLRPPAVDQPVHLQFGLSKVRAEERFLRDLFYGNTWEYPDEATGLSPYYGSLDPAEAKNAVNVLDAGGRGRFCASAFLVCWAPHSVFIAWSINEAQELSAAIIPADWRYVVRVANIDIERRDADLATLLSRAALKVPSLADRAAFYVGDPVADMLAEQVAEEHADVKLFKTVPVRRVAALRGDESVVGSKRK